MTRLKICESVLIDFIEFAKKWEKIDGLKYENILRTITQKPHLNK